MSAPVIGLDNLPPEERFRPPAERAALDMIRHVNEMEELRAVPERAPVIPTRADRLKWLAAELLNLPFGDFVKFCAGTEADPPKVHEWAKSYGIE